MHCPGLTHHTCDSLTEEMKAGRPGGPLNSSILMLRPAALCLKHDQRTDITRKKHSTHVPTSIFRDVI